MYYLYNEFRKFNDVELHIISESKYATKTIHYNEGNTNFYWIKKGPPILKFGYPPNFRFDTLTGYYCEKIKILKLIENIKPDIINSHGTEYAFSYVILDLNKPKLISIQGFISEIKKYSNELSIYNFFQSKFELETLKKEKYFMTGGIEFIEEKIKKFNPQAKFFPIYYPISDYAFELGNKFNSLNKKTDFIYVGGFNKLKGIYDFIEALGLLKSKGINFNAKVAGIINKKIYKDIKERVKKLDLVNNVIFIGFLQEHSDLLTEISMAKVFVLPTYCDTGARSIAESMAIGTPVIAYNTDGIPTMIKDGERGFLVKKGNVSLLANKMEEVLSNFNSKYLIDIILNAKNYAHQNFKSKNIANYLLNAYKTILNEWKR
jgi:glycosyltransferase involved in cell wall biosynthesis